MRILVDATILKPAQAGIGTYTRGVIDGLVQLPDTSVAVITSDPESVGSAGCDVVPAPRQARDFAKRLLWRELTLRGAVRRTMADVVLFPCPELPFRPLPVPAVVVVHDVGAVVAPALYGRGKQWRFALDLRRVLRFADHVVCVSHAAERALRSYFGARQTSVIPEGCAMSVPRSKRTPVSPPFALYVGTLQTHKNVETLVRGIARLRSPDLRLVLAGTAAAPERAGFQRLCRELGVADRVTHHGWVGREELSRLYSECSVVVVPSLSEGFGLPLLEAFAHGAPAIASNLSVFHEIGGDTPRYVDEPLSPSAWAHAIDAAVADAAWLSVSERRGIDAAAAFSWRRTAASLRAVCGRVA